MVQKYLKSISPPAAGQNGSTGIIPVEQLLERALRELNTGPEKYADLEAALNCALTIARRRAAEQHALGVIRSAHKEITPVLTISEVVVAAYATFRQFR